MDGRPEEAPHFLWSQGTHGQGLIPRLLVNVAALIKCSTLPALLAKGREGDPGKEYSIWAKC